MDDFKVVSALEMCVALNWNWLSMFHSSECAPVQALSTGGSPMPKIGRPIQKPSRKGLGHMRFFLVSLYLVNGGEVMCLTGMKLFWVVEK